ncbi:hypothetical protein HDU98_005000 [Podochytrium sp. JEL0797]|nr:hypothetical protein HDU98_005000 [Podochytrium sp. JEL0797]
MEHNKITFQYDPSMEATDPPALTPGDNQLMSEIKEWWFGSSFHDTGPIPSAMGFPDLRITIPSIRTQPFLLSGGSETPSLSASSEFSGEYIDAGILYSPNVPAFGHSAFSVPGSADSIEYNWLFEDNSCAQTSSPVSLTQPLSGNHVPMKPQTNAPTNAFTGERFATHDWWLPDGQTCRQVSSPVTTSLSLQDLKIVTIPSTSDQTSSQAISPNREIHPAARPSSAPHANKESFRQAPKRRPSLSPAEYPCDPPPPSALKPPRPTSLYKSIDISHCKKSKKTNSQHLRGASVTLFSCPYEGCTRAFDRSFNLRAHFSTHLGMKLFMCEGCKKQFTRRFDVKRHQTGVCEGFEILLCND